MKKKILGYFFIFLAVGGIIAIFSPGDESPTTVTIIAIVCGIIGVRLIKQPRDKEPTSEKETVKKEKELMKKEKDKELKASIYAKHVSGLPISQDVSVNIDYNYDTIKISSSGANFNISCDKISGMSYTMEKDLVSISHTSSIGKAALGGVILGPVGVILGGRKKTHKDFKKSWIWLINYISDGETKYLAFETSDINLKVSKVCQVFSRREKPVLNIDL